MHNLKARIFAVLLVLLSGFLIYLNWKQLMDDGKYSMKLAAFAPVVGVGGFYLFFFPSRIGKPETTRDKIIVLAVIVMGLLAGLFNWYLMDPGFFTR